MVALSILDIVPIPDGCTPGDALRRSLGLARKAEQWGYRRYWVAEHHNMIGAAGAATGTVVGYIAGGTETIRVGAGGIMLPNHAPLVVAEQFGTLESLYPGRIDLGLGRAPGTDPITAKALRRDPVRAGMFTDEVFELRRYFAPSQQDQVVEAVPGAGLSVPLWILGSSESGARTAAALGLPFAFASHFAPSGLPHALKVYREEFKPSDQCSRPYTVLGVNVVVADTDREAEWQFTSIQQRFLNIVRGQPRRLPAPAEMSSRWSPDEKSRVCEMLSHSFAGTLEVVREKLTDFIKLTAPDELIVSATLFDAEARLRSYELLAQI